MLAVVAGIVFVIAAVIGFLGVWSNVGVISLACVGLAALAFHFAFWATPVAIRRA